eukprot:1022918-Pyramimonas_sp.AAC.1
MLKWVDRIVVCVQEPTKYSLTATHKKTPKPLLLPSTTRALSENRRAIPPRQRNGHRRRGW